VDIVRVDFAVPLPGVMAAGEKAQLKPATELQESKIGVLKLPLWAATLTLRVPEPPAGTASDDGAAPRDKLDVPPELLPHRLEVKPAGPEMWFAILALPTAWTKSL
jgi:hypothetical protein